MHLQLSINLFQDHLVRAFWCIIVVHSFEVLYALHLCEQLKLSEWTTAKWIVSVALNGVFALKMLYNPKKYKVQ